MSTPEVGDIAPDALLMDPDGLDVHLSSMWRSQPAVVVFLRYFADLSYVEIADVLGISIGTVKSRLARGRADLKKSLMRYLSVQRV